MSQYTHILHPVLYLYDFLTLKISKRKCLCKYLTDYEDKHMCLRIHIRRYNDIKR